MNYLDSTNQSLASSLSAIGKKADGTYITDYHLSDLPDFPLPADTSTYPSPVMTPTEQAALDQALSSYYSIGDQVTVTPPAISGYVTPAAKTFTLSGGSNNGEFVYKKKLVKVDFSKPAGSTDNPATNSASASTLDDSLANSTLRVDTAAQCRNIDEARLLPASGFAAPIEGYTTLGGIDFTISCANPGGDTKVNLDLSTKMTNQSSIKIYKRTASKTIDITDKVTIADVNGKTSIAYSLTDGGELDDDGLVNGVIVDPIYITVPGEDGMLADTGVDSTATLVAGVAISYFWISSPEPCL